jgi:8-oxo-dGTP pyrophosphatase MutT (NUDIX family)
MFERIRQVLQSSQRKEISAEGLIPASVLVPLFVKENEVHFLMEKRPEELDHHKGQIAFPGGVREEADPDAVATALREAEEEVGLSSRDVCVLGLLDDTRTVTGFCITPVVAVVPYPYPFRVNVSEVEEILQVPWSVFSKSLGYRQEQWEHEGRVYEVDYYSYQNRVIWGATARICRKLVECVSAGSKEVLEK